MNILVSLPEGGVMPHTNSPSRSTTDTATRLVEPQRKQRGARFAVVAVLR